MEIGTKENFGTHVASRIGEKENVGKHLASRIY